MKWEPVAAMIALLLLGVWLVWGQSYYPGLPEASEGARLVEVRLGAKRGLVEIVPAVGEAGGERYRFLWRDGKASEPMTAEAIAAQLGPGIVEALQPESQPGLFRLLNITSWLGVVWVAIGLGGQIAFFGRMLIQWIVSENKRESVVPEAFWWLSLFGGVALFTYFVWRRDIVGVMGQSTGVVIYARNLRLIHKQRRRAARAAAEAVAPEG